LHELLKGTILPSAVNASTYNKLTFTHRSTSSFRWTRQINQAPMSKSMVVCC